MLLEDTKTKSGDTLIEVCIAAAIFSLVITGVVSVVSSAISGSQAVLENTVTRAEIDAQAEALRFIHSSYVSSGKLNSTENKRIGDIWNKIAGRAIDLSSSGNSGVAQAILAYRPATCAELYRNDNNNSIIKQNAFALNINGMGTQIEAEDFNVNNIVITPTTNSSSKFSVASTYPRITYGTSDIDRLFDITYKNESVRSVEGLFIVPVKDKSSTYIVDKNGNAKKMTAYYDFYIRSCWFAPGAAKPTTISTVVRLYNPAISLD